MVSIIVHATMLALSLILPLGVQNVFIFTQGASQPRLLYVVPVVLTAAACDILLITLAVTGLSLVLLLQESIRFILLGLGILFLVVMGRATWKSKPRTSDEQVVAMTARKQILFTASVSLLNPHAILDTVGVIGTSSLQYNGADKLVFALTCMAISLLWFTALALAGRTIGKLDRTGRLMNVLNKLSAIMMWGIAAYLAYSLLNEW